MALLPSVEMPEEVRKLVSRYRKGFVTVALLSALLNILVLAGSLYLMMVYDSVLPSHSLPTLFGLLGLLLFVYAFQGVMDNMRTNILADIANSFDRALSRRVQSAMTETVLAGGRGGGDGLSPMRDLESVRSFLASSGPATLIDLPWMVFFIAILWLLHWALGLTALIGAAILFSLTLVTNRVTKVPTARLSIVGAYRNGHAEANLRHIEMLTAMGMRGRMMDRWFHINASYLAAQRSLAKSVGVLGGFSRIGRMLLQSLILTVGAILVIEGEASGGVIFASSTIAARALAPIDSLIANFRSLAAARLGWQRLCQLLGKVPAEPEIQTVLPAPAASVQAQGLVIAPPGSQRVAVQGVDFSLNAGDGLAIIGPSASGKSSLARVLVGAWRPVRGTVRMDGAAIEQWPNDVLGASIGYLPQTVELLDGTVAENISRFETDASSEAIIHAAKTAGVHDMIVGLPQGYETPVGQDGGNLSGGQQQRIGLARALYKDPFFVLLDEPNSNLDADGDKALEAAIASVRDRSGVVVVIAHRAAALAQVNLVMFMRDGRCEAFGPRDEVLQKVMARPVSIASGGPAAVDGRGAPPASAAAS